ncbi:MAG: hypothetical protein V4793_24135, partial [Paraburkholderia tropica]
MDTTIKNAPPRIFLNLGDGLPSEEIDFSSLHEVTWCADKQYANDVEYVIAALPSDAAGAPLPVAWRYQTPTGWHATTDSAAATRVADHHEVQPLYAAPVAPTMAAPQGFSIKRVEGHGWYIDPPTGSRWVAHEGTPAGDLIAALTAAPAPTVAADAAAPINLEGLRKKLLTPRKILRDEDGYLSHPDFPICDEGTNAGKFLDAFGIDAEFVAMESDDPVAAERYFEAGEAHCSYWTPKPPEGDGWILLEIFDTEDGPCALFGRDRYEAENALKRQR